MARAARRTSSHVDRLVGNHEVRAAPGRAPSIPGVDGVVHAPYGAHPFASPGHYLHRRGAPPRVPRRGNACPQRRPRPARGLLRRVVRGPAVHCIPGPVGVERLYALKEGLNHGVRREPDYSLDELLACVISREFEDGERVFLGANVNFAPRRRAARPPLRAPNMRVMRRPLLDQLARPEPRRPARRHSPTSATPAGPSPDVHLDTMIDSYRFFSTTFVIGGIQIDRFGNSNLIGIGDDHKRPKLRGPGAIGSVSSTAYCDRFYMTPPPPHEGDLRREVRLRLLGRLGRGRRRRPRRTRPARPRPAASA